MLAQYKNGQLINAVSGLDRGFLYGDGLFTSLKVLDSTPVFWQYHQARLEQGARVLGLNIDFEALYTHVFALCQIHTFSVIKIILTRGEGVRGYASGDTPACAYTQVFALSTPFHTSIQPAIVSGVLGQSLGRVMPTLAGIKTLNRLDQVILARELSTLNLAEALVCDVHGFIVEGVSSNCFMKIDGAWCTPDLTEAGVSGVMRAFILNEKNADPLNHQSKHNNNQNNNQNNSRNNNQPITIRKIHREEIDQIQALFFCNAIVGVRPVMALQSDTALYLLDVGAVSEFLVDLF